MDIIPIALIDEGKHSDDINAVAITDDGAFAVTASYDKSLIVWDLKKRVSVHTLTGHKRSVTSVVVIPGTHKVISGSQDSNLAVWNLDTGCLEEVWNGHSAEVLSLAVMPAGRRAFSGAQDDSIRVWDVSSGRQSEIVDVKEFEVDGVVLDLNQFMFKSEVEEWAKTLKRPSCLACSHDSDIIWIGTVCGNIIKYDLGLKKQVGCLAGHKDVVSSVAISKDRQWALSSSYDKTVRLWKLDGSSTVFFMEGHSEAVFGASFLENEKFGVSVSGDKRINIWDLQTGSLALAEETEYSLYCCCASPDGKTILAGTGEKQGRLLLFELQM